AIFCDAVDRRCFLRMFADVCASHRLECYAYCLMSNHYHIVLKTLEANLSHAFQVLNSGYAIWWNKRRKRVGHLLQGRFDSPVVQDGAYLLNVCRYVARNPVVAGLVREPDAWRWSSYRATVGLAPAPAFLKRDGVLRLFDADSRRIAAA